MTVMFFCCMPGAFPRAWSHNQGHHRRIVRRLLLHLLPEISRLHRRLLLPPQLRMVTTAAASWHVYSPYYTILWRFFFQMFQKSFKAVFYPFVANSFTSMLAPKPLNSYSFLIKCDSLHADPFPWLALSAEEGCSGNNVSWYRVLSKLTSFTPEDWRLCRFVVPKIIDID